MSQAALALTEAPRSVSLKPKRKTMVTMTWEHISPARAKNWITNTMETSFHQRGLSKGNVAKYAGEMERGDWHEDTADVIRLTGFGGLEVASDGQHRLSAIVKSGVGIDMWVARNVPEDAFKYIDQGANRTLTDVMTASDYPSPRILSVAGSNLWKYYQTGSPLRAPDAENKLSAGNTLDWIEENVPDLKEFWIEEEAMLRKVKREGAGPESTMLYLLYRWVDLDPELARDFMTYLSDPTMNQPRLKAMAVAYRYVYDFKAANKNAKTSEWHNVTLAVLQAYTAVWNAMREHKQIKTQNGLTKILKEMGTSLPDLV